MTKYDVKVPVEFEVWKKAVIEAWRVFVPAFLTVLYVQFQAGVKLDEWRSWLFPLAVSAVLAGVKAIWRWYRDTYGEGNYGSWMYKLPL